MYNPIIDDFDNDAAPSRDAGIPVEPIAEVDEDLNEASKSIEPETKSKQQDELLVPDDSESWSDDPVRMYLTQMGEIPLLTRKEEIRLAKKIEITRRQFRAKLLECDYVMQAAFKVIGRVHQGELPFDRTVQVSVTDRLEKEQILGRLPHNLATVEVLLKRNRRDYHLAISKSQAKSRRKVAW